MREGVTPLRVKSWLHPPLYKRDLASRRRITRAAAPPPSISEGALHFGLDKKNA